MILVLRSRWNESITSSLEEAAIRHLENNGFKTQSSAVPGALEFPLAVEWFAQKHSDELQGVVVCGTIIRGDTYHFELVANESHRALMDISVRRQLPIGHAILACDTIEQAVARSEGSKNKGIEAAQAVIEMLQLKKQKDL
jgi:6,7-dimethyl-8-ribityllumazine synthase